MHVGWLKTSQLGQSDVEIGPLGFSVWAIDGCLCRFKRGAREIQASIQAELGSTVTFVGDVGLLSDLSPALPDPAPDERAAS